MADNVAITAGSGTSVGTDDVSGVHFQKIKIADGAADSSAMIGGDATNGLDVDVTRLPALVAGSANIGDVDVLTVPADPFGANADAASATGSISAKLRQIAANGISVSQATAANLNATEANSGSIKTAVELIDDSIFQDDAGFTVGTSKVNMAGMVAVAHGSNPDAADANDAVAALTNRHRIPFQIGGHPNIITSSIRLTGSSTDAAVIAGTIASGTKVVVTRLTVNVSNATTVNIGCKIGFGASTLPADSTTGAAGVLVDSDGFPPGGGVNIGDGSGIIGIGADGEEIRITNDAPTSGALHVTCSYYTIES